MSQTVRRVRVHRTILHLKDAAMAGRQGPEVFSLDPTVCENGAEPLRRAAGWLVEIACYANPALQTGTERAPE